MNEHLSKLKEAITPYREHLINHPVYQAIVHIKHLHCFMEYHIYAVWDFMSLLKSLQKDLTCVGVPWFPVGSANTRYLINEIVAGEESDVNEVGDRMSHYELYLNAMAQCEAMTAPFETFIAVLQQTSDFTDAFRQAGTPEAARNFVNYTFEVICSGQPHRVAAAFTFGREDLIPDLFHAIVRDLNLKFPDQLSKFNYYLERHIEVDGGHHSQLALEMTSELCGTDAQKWQEATDAAIAALKNRIGLWDGILQEISQPVAVHSL